MKSIYKRIIVIMLIIIFALNMNIALAVTQQDINNQKNEQNKINNQIDEAEKNIKNLKRKNLKL